jgi:hypothetical protein
MQILFFGKITDRITILSLTHTIKKKNYNNISCKAFGDIYSYFHNKLLNDQLKSFKDQTR